MTDCNKQCLAQICIQNKFHMQIILGLVAPPVILFIHEFQSSKGINPHEIQYLAMSEEY